MTQHADRMPKSFDANAGLIDFHDDRLADFALREHDGAPVDLVMRSAEPAWNRL